MINKECYYDCKEYFEKVGIVISISKEPVVWQLGYQLTAISHSITWRLCFEKNNFANCTESQANGNFGIIQNI